LAGVPWSYNKEHHHYWVRPGYLFPALNLSDDEMIGQATASVITNSPGLDVTKGAAPATRKLWMASREKSSKLLDDVEKVTSVLDLKLADHSRSHETIRTIQWALCQGRRLTGIYTSPYEARPKRLELHPYRLCLVQRAWYLIARSEDSDNPQTYRVTRFKTLRPLDFPTVVPTDFDLKAYFGNAWGVYRGRLSYEVEVRFSREAADIVTETTWHTTQKVECYKDGSVSLHFVTDGLSEIVYWILGWSGRVTVINPPELRVMVLEHLRRAVELHRS
jgi:predicted DNA-binding transcriptional regulator YafY